MYFLYVDKLAAYLEDSKAEKLAEQLFKLYGNESDSKKRNKRKHRVSFHLII